MKLKQLPQFTFCFVCTLVTAALAMAMLSMHGVSAA